MCSKRFADIIDFIWTTHEAGWGKSESCLRTSTGVQGRATQSLTVGPWPSRKPCLFKGMRKRINFTMSAVCFNFSTSHFPGYLVPCALWPLHPTSSSWVPVPSPQSEHVPWRGWWLGTGRRQPWLWVLALMFVRETPLRNSWLTWHSVSSFLRRMGNSCLLRCHCPTEMVWQHPYNRVWHTPAS